MSGVTEPELRHIGFQLAGVSREERQQVNSDVLGFWAFLMSDAVIFALLFSIYVTMLEATAGGPGGHQEFKFSSAFWETMLLLTSSFAYGMASVSARYARKDRWVLLWLAITFGLGAGFLNMEAHDFISMFHDNAGPDRSGYLSSFFVLVGTHGSHVLSGLLWILAMGVQIAMYGLDRRTRVNLVRLGLFWHFLDIVWVVIFSVVYLHGLIR